MKRHRQALFEPLTWTRGILYALAFPAALLAALVFMYGVAAWRMGYTWREMDWDGSGQTSIGEFLHSRDVGNRIVQQSGRLCAEFYEMSNGRRIRLSCPTD
jgi:hypothetical protein